jgi:cell division protein FtsI (penicillin-binding protein 3)
LTERVRQRQRTGRRGRPDLRLRIGLLLVAMVLSVFAVRLLQLQGIDPGSYASAALAQNRVTVSLPAQRGEILARNGTPLADSVDGEMVIADPALTREKAPALAKLLAKRLGVDYATTLQRLRKKGSRFQYIARHKPAHEVDAVIDAADGAGFAGLTTESDPIRDYPQGDVAANLVGFEGTDGPLAGLELSLNKTLSGTDGSATYEASGGTRIPLAPSKQVSPVNGRNVRTTLDPDLQWYAQKQIAQAVQEHDAKDGCVVVMDTRTGQLLAYADYPSFDPNDPSTSTASDRNPTCLDNPYEPGSVEKTLTLSSAINSGYITDRTKVAVPSQVMSGGYAIHDWYPHGTIHLTSAGVLAQSSNIGTVELAKHFKKDELRHYLVRFGLGQKTNIGLLGETAGILPSVQQWSQPLQDRIDFGQSVAVNAIQMTAAVNTIANHGVYVSPSLILGSATENDGTRVGTAHTVTRRVISAKAAEETEQMMQRVTDAKVGVGPQGAIPGYLVAGKTGGAQEVDPKTGRYSSGFTVSYAGFAPADNARFTVYVVLDHPADGAGGGAGAGPVFNKVMSFALQRYGVPPTTTKPSTLPTSW